jgi:hypothetical protein
MKIRSPEEKRKTMEANYAMHCANLRGKELVDFHRERLTIFLRRFGGFIQRFRTPQSSWLHNDLFLCVEAITNIVKSDFQNAASNEARKAASSWFKEYLEQFELLRHGSIDLNEGTNRCLSILNDK